jgi:N-acetylneuraminic acid mutarotase
MKALQELSGGRVGTRFGGVSKEPRKRAGSFIQLTAVLTAVALNFCGIQPVQAASFTNTTPLSIARESHTATLLQNGKVLVVGGLGNSNVLSDAQLYDPATGLWTSTGSLNTGRWGHTATLLTNGRVLVAGGYTAGPIACAELYDPIAGTWTNAGVMHSPRVNHAATLLPNGKVLVVGGYDGTAGTAGAELFDPATSSWTTTGSLTNARYFHTATLLPNGTVLVAGGSGDSDYLASVEIYDPVSQLWTATNSLNVARSGHTANLLPNGQVLIAGGVSDGGYLASSELFNPIVGTWTATSNLMTNARSGHTATLLPSGLVLAAGGSSSNDLASTELFNPATGLWTTNVAMATARYFHTATLLPGGKVLVAAGGGTNGLLASAELYDLAINPATGVWTNTGNFGLAFTGHTATLLPDGTTLVAGGAVGTPGPEVLTNAELYDAVAGTWTNTGGMITGRANHTATLLPNGKVLVAGGATLSVALASAELYDPVMRTWKAAGSLNAARAFHTATLLPNGKVLVAGGSPTNVPISPLSTAEIYDPANDAWTTVASMSTTRFFHTATLLPNGQVLVAGGFGDSGITASTECFDPGSGTWTVVIPLTTARDRHTATLLPDGKVLVAGGNGVFGALVGPAELYDPACGAWTDTGAMITPRTELTATLLPNGKVLAAGGSLRTNAELYEPATGMWTATAGLHAARELHTATLLPDGQVLVVAGEGNLSPNNLVSVERYDAGLGFSNSWQPQIATVTSPLNINSNLTLTGSGFRRIAEGSGGNGSQDSPADYPVVQLRSLESGRTMFLPAMNWSASSFNSAPVWGLTPGWTMATVFVNGIPSTGSILNISVPVPTFTTLANLKTLTNGAFQFTFTNTPGVVLGGLATTDLTLPLTNWTPVWTPMGAVTEVAPGQFQLTDLQAVINARRFYAIRVP